MKPAVFITVSFAAPTIATATATEVRTDITKVQSAILGFRAGIMADTLLFGGVGQPQPGKR